MHGHEFQLDVSSRG